MTDSDTQDIDVGELRVGHFVFLDLGWIRHPFPLSSFKIQSAEQIKTIRSLGLRRIRYSPGRSGPESDVIEPAATSPLGHCVSETPTAEELAKSQRRELLSQQRASLQRCERQFDNAANAYRQITKSAYADPQAARVTCEALVGSLLAELRGAQEANIRLLAEKVGDRPSLHAINVTVLALLLGRACCLDDSIMTDIGVGALLHDLGKAELPDRLRFLDQFERASEQQLFQEHVAYSVSMAKRMELASDALLAIGQHHEYADGTGYPLGAGNEKLHPASRVVALINHYDNLCNPVNPLLALTPHEALAQIFAKTRAKFDTTLLNAFVRMMGVYPPGSVVQLSDERYALVVSVNSSRPLKPRVVVHDPEISAEEALIVDLESESSLGICRSLKPLQLPSAVLAYLSPRKRVSYFFEPARSVDDGAVAA